MWLKTIIKALLLIGLGVLIGYGWFRFGAVFEPVFKAVVALANKLARISWVIVTTGEPFDMQQAFKPAV